MSWTFLRTRFDTLNEARNKAFDLNVEFEKSKKAIKTFQPAMSLYTSEEESSKDKLDEGDEDDDIKSHASSPGLQGYLSQVVDSSQVTSSPTQVVSPGSVYASPEPLSIT